MNSKAKVVQMGRQPQYAAPAHGQPQYNVQARPMNVQVVQAPGMHPGQPMMMQGGAMQMQQQRGSITMGMQQPGQYPMQTVPAMPIHHQGMIAPSPGAMGMAHAQPMGTTQAPFIAATSFSGNRPGYEFKMG